MIGFFIGYSIGLMFGIIVFTCMYIAMKDDEK